MKQKTYDFIIAGAGPVGLAAAITAGRLGAKCIIVEKGSKPGPHPRGESIADYPFMDELLGKNWLKENSSNDPSFRRFHSPMSRKNTLIDVHRPYYFFHWETLINHMTKLAEEMGTEILLQSEVTEIIERDKQCIGIKYTTVDNSVHELHGSTVLNCMGHKDPLGTLYNINREDINCPTMKYFSRSAPNVNVATHPNLQFYMIPPGMLEIAPDLPPAVAYVFPLKNGEMEAGLMLRLGPMKNVKIPDEEKMHRVWDYLTEFYPGFSDFFKGAETSYKKLTVISNRSLYENVIPHENGGLIFLGDSIGFSEANGSSGLYFGMAQADFWVHQIMESETESKSVWNDKIAADLIKNYRKWSVYKFIKKSYRDIVLAEKIMFKIFGTEKLMNICWKPLMAILQMKS